MNILVSCMGYDAGRSGISSYMRNVAQNLKNSPHHFTLIIEPDSAKDFDGFDLIITPKLFSKSLLGMLWHFLILPFYTFGDKYDCILILAASRRYLAFSKIPQIGVVHDLSPYRVEEKYDPLRMFYLKKLQPWLGKRLDSVSAISQSTKNDVAKYWGIPLDKITLNYNGLNKLPQADDLIQTRLKLHKYILYVSRIEYPGKNHVGLIKAYEMLPSDLQNTYQLVIAGSEWKGAAPVKEYAQKSPFAHRIIFTGFVTSEELSSLYKHASLFVFPSFSEGFGLPLIEAMSEGIPCACSNTTSLAEIGGNAALQFDPNKPQEIRSAIEKILIDNDFSDTLVKKGLLQSKQYSWHIHTQTLLKMCELYSNN